MRPLPCRSVFVCCPFNSLVLFAQALSNRGLVSRCVCNVRLATINVSVASSCVMCSHVLCAADPGQISCIDCPAGSMCPGKGRQRTLFLLAFSLLSFLVVHAEPSQCAAGFYTDTQQATACLQCAAGTFAANTGSLICLPCSPGSAAPQNGSTTCTTCQPGSFSASDFTRCNPCPITSYNPVLSQASCLSCPVASYCNTTGLSSPYSCQAGRFSALPGASQCQPCETGTFNGELSFVF